MNKPKLPLEDSINKDIEPAEEFKSLETLPYNQEKYPHRTSSFRTKDSQIQIVRKNLLGEPVFIILY